MKGYYSEYFYSDRQENRTCGFKLSPKWMSKDGKHMTLIWSDAGDNHSTNYKWNQKKTVKYLLHDIAR